MNQVRILLFLPFLVFSQTVGAQSSLTWNGGAGSGNWSQTNWSGLNTPTNGRSLIFGGTTQTITTNDVNSLSVNSIVFGNTAGSFVVSGNAMTISNGITNLSTSGQIFSNAITLAPPSGYSPAPVVFNASAGNFTFAGNLALSNRSLTISGTADTMISGTVSGGLSGGISKTGNGFLTLEGNNTFGGTLNLSAGSTLVNGTQATRSIQVSGGSSTLTLGNNNRIANNADVTLSGGGTLATAGFSDTIGSLWLMDGKVTGTGTITASSYGLNGGTIDANLGGGSAYVQSGENFLNGTFGAAQLGLYAGGNLTAGSAGRFINTPDVNIAANSTLYLAGSETFRTLTGAGQVNGGAGTLTIAGPIYGFMFDGGISGATALTLESNTYLTLTGSNHYTGVTTVKQNAFLTVESGGSMANSSLTTVKTGAALTANGTVGNLMVESGGGVYGSGTVSGTATIAGILQPGNSLGVLTVTSDLTFANYGGMVWELFANVNEQDVSSAVTTVFDQVVVGGNLHFAGGNMIDVNFGSSGIGSVVDWNNPFWDSDASWVIFSVAGATTGFENATLSVNTLDANGASLETVREGAKFELNQQGSNVLLKYLAVPEPSSASLLVAGTIGLLALSRRRKS